MSNISVDPILSPLKGELLRLIEDQLSNNDVSSDEELHTYFVSSGLTGLQATRAIQYRKLYLRSVFLDGHTPILKGGNALWLNPESDQYELIR